MNEYKLDNGKRQYRTLTMLCEDESLSDYQLKAYQTRFQEYRTFLEAVTRLASCGNVCITEESVMVGENGMLNGESLNALQHAGAISVYNALQLNNWEFPVPDEGDVAVTRENPEICDELLDSENPIRSDWPAIHVSDCFIEGDKAKLHGSVRPLRTFLPPSISFRNAADMEEDVSEQDSTTSNPLALTDDIEIVNSQKGLLVKRTKKEKTREVEYLSIDEYFYGKQDPSPDYSEEKADYKFKCAVCQRMFTSNVKLMHHILEHVDEACPALMCLNDTFNCQDCQVSFESAYEFKMHQTKIHGLGKDQASFYQRHNEEDPMEESQLPITKVDCEFECKICGKECPTKLSLGHHLQFTHRYKEMPYVCRLCLFRSSIYEDILEHFFKNHSNTSHLLCAYCLRIFTPTDARPAGQSPPSQSVTGAVTTVGLGAGVGQTQVYLQHLRMHQVKHHVRSCGCCKLNFTNKSDFQIHRRLDHRSTLPNNPYPNELRLRVKGSQQIANKEYQKNRDDPKAPEDVMSEQFIEAVQASVDNQNESISNNVSNEQIIITNPITGVSYKTNGKSSQFMETETHSFSDQLKQNEPVKPQQPASKISRLKAATVFAPKEKQVKIESSAPAIPKDPKNISLNAPEPGRMKDLSSVSCDRLTPKKHPCLECEKFLMDGNHRRYLPCSACSFATCCAASFNRHVQSMHMKDSSKLATSQYQKSMPFLKPMKFPWTHLIGKGSTIKECENDDFDMHDLGKVKNYKIDSFHCKQCGFSAQDGNSLACHLVEECGSTTVTMNPPPELIENYTLLLQRRQVEEEKYRSNDHSRRQHQNVSSTAQLVTEIEEIDETIEDQCLTAAGDEEVQPQQQQLHLEAHQSGAMVVQTLGVLLPNQAVELTNDQGEVFQSLTWPEDLVIEEDQIVVIMQGEDGQVQLAVVSQQSYDPITQQVIIGSAEEQTANVEAAASEGFPMTEEEEKENIHDSDMIDEANMA